MSRLIESIKIENKEVKLLKYHQARMDLSLKKLGFSNPHNLDKIFSKLNLSMGIYKWRLTYDEKKIHLNEISEYNVIYHKTFELVEIPKFDYSLKWENRTCIDLQKQKSNASEIIMYQHKIIIESSYANLVFINDQEKITPKNFLLNGVQRQYLLSKGHIKAAEIKLSDLDNFHSFRLINALLGFDNSPIYPINIINLS